MDAYVHASASVIPTYLHVDEAYEEWWNETPKLRDKPKINRKYVLQAGLTVRNCTIQKVRPQY